MERVAAAYRRFLGGALFGLLRIRLEPGHEAIGLPIRRPALIRFRTPAFREGPGWAEVSWAIEDGLLVAREGRGRGSLRIRIESLDSGPELRSRALVRAEVEGYHPVIRGRGPLASAGSRLYRSTQVRVHRHVMRGFLSSLAELDPPAGDPATIAEGG
jgi:hypothetical protein